MFFLRQRWLAGKGRFDEARASIARVRGVPVEEAGQHTAILREVDEIRENVVYEAKVKGGWIDCFNPNRKVLYRTLLGTLASFRLFSKL